MGLPSTTRQVRRRKEKDPAEATVPTSSVQAPITRVTALPSRTSPAESERDLPALKSNSYSHQRPLPTRLLLSMLPALIAAMTLALSALPSHTSLSTALTLQISTVGHTVPEGVTSAHMYCHWHEYNFSHVSKDCKRLQRDPAGNQARLAATKPSDAPRAVRITILSMYPYS